MRLKNILKLPPKEFVLKLIKKIEYYREICVQSKDSFLLKKAFMDGSEEYCEKVRWGGVRRLVRILKYAQRYSPYYSEIFAERKITDNNCYKIMNDIPVLIRKNIIDNFETMKSSKLKFLPYGEMSTSGTTGVPLKFIESPNGEFQHQMFLYSFITDFKYRKIDLNRIVSFGGGYLDDKFTKEHIFWTISNDKYNLYGNVLFSSFYILRENIPYYIKELNKINPIIIRSYPSCLLLFIDYCNELGVKPNIDVAGIYVTSESSTEEQLNKISSFFNCGVYGQYGHSEAAIFAFTKKNQTKYYCSPLYGYTQVVDDDGHEVLVGEIGNVCVTSFTNFAMPFIKYLTGDKACYGGTYNGFVVLEKLIGRGQDYVLNSDNEKLFIIVGQFSECFLPAMNRIKCWQAVQKEIGKIYLKIVKKDDYTEEDEKDIVSIMKENKIETTIEYVEDIPLTARGKRKYIINELVDVNET